MTKFAKGYTNHEQTDASGLIYMQARFYLPMYGRFGSPDPARDQHFELTQSWNIYSYVRNSPTMQVDPTGLATYYLDGNEVSGPVSNKIHIDPVQPENNATSNNADGNGSDQGDAQTNASTSGVLVSRSVTTTLSIVDGGSGDYNASYTLTQSTTSTYWVPSSNERVEHTVDTVLAHGDIRTVPDNSGNGSPTLNGTYTWVNHAHNGGFPTVQVRGADGSGALATTGLNPNTGTFRQTGINIHPPNPNSSRVWQEPGASLSSASARERPFSMGCWQPRPDANGRALIDGMRNARGSREIYLNTSWNEGRTFD